MDWKVFNTKEQIEEIISESFEHPLVIFKHSTRCFASRKVYNMLDESEGKSTIHFYFLDLIKYRQVSNAVADQFQVEHESPQVLLIYKGKCVYSDSHGSIDMEEILSRAENEIALKA